MAVAPTDAGGAADYFRLFPGSTCRTDPSRPGCSWSSATPKAYVDNNDGSVRHSCPALYGRAPMECPARTPDGSGDGIWNVDLLVRVGIRK